jgi:glycosyl transferase family 25
MRIYLINLDRRPDRLAAMRAQALRLGLELNRVTAVDAAIAQSGEIDGWFQSGGPLGEIPRGDKACLLSHRRAWEMFFNSGEPHAVVLEDDVGLSPAAARILVDDGWIPSAIAVLKLEHYGPPSQRVLICDIAAIKAHGKEFQVGRMLSRHTGAAAYILSRKAAQVLLEESRFELPVDHLLFNPNNSRLFESLSPWQLLPAIARQEAGRSDIEATRKGLRILGLTYAKRELVRLGYDAKLLPRQAVALLRGAKFVSMKMEP